jgi:hypothetical protein
LQRIVTRRKQNAKNGQRVLDISTQLVLVLGDLGTGPNPEGDVEAFI